MCSTTCTYQQLKLRKGKHKLDLMNCSLSWWRHPTFQHQIRSYIPPAKPGSLKHTVGTPQVLKSCLQETLDFTRSAKWCLFLPCIWKNYIRLSLGGTTTTTTTTTTLYKGCYLTYLSSQPPPRSFLDVVCFSCVLFLWSVHFHDTTTGDHQMLQLWQMTSVVVVLRLISLEKPKEVALEDATLIFFRKWIVGNPVLCAGFTKKYIAGVLFQ